MPAESIAMFRKMCGLLLPLLLPISLSANPPSVSDPELSVTLFAEAPDIVTPIGLTVDSMDRVFVIESHTHHQPEDYDGPESDQIKILVDQDDDGRADQIEVFADGMDQAMNLAFSPQGDLFVVCAREVLRLSDDDGDGRCDQQQQILRLDTKERYPHNSLLGITFDRDGWMYVARGNTGSNLYRLVGQDDSFVEGYGDGGSVIRCRADGTELEEFATGFWNPFDLKWDHRGRLLLVDNDPDARGPNRLLQVVRGGDYGYKSMFGGEGTHPFQGWDGSLPGTLPFIAGTGEAPSGVIDGRRTAFGPAYRESILATIWNEHTIERFELDPQSGELLTKSILVSGDQQFRPVALDADSRGNLFISDWVKVDYPNHGHGRIWRISPTRTGDRRVRSRFDSPADNPQRDAMRAASQAVGEGLLDVLRTTTDPMVRHAAVLRLAENDRQTEREAGLAGGASLRLATLLAMKRRGSMANIRRFFTDPSVAVRRAALLWAAESLDLGLAEALRETIRTEPVTPELFESYLAAVEVLTPDFRDAFRERGGKANQIPRPLDPAVLVEVARTQAFSTEVRSLAIGRFDEATAKANRDLLVELLSASDDLVIAALDALSSIADESLLETCIAVARDEQRSDEVRTHALALLAELPSPDGLIASIETAGPRRVAVQAARTRAWRKHSGAASPVKRLPEQWRELLEGDGDPILGRHVFFSNHVGCYKCHGGRGVGDTLGPSLAGLADSKSRGQIIDAILEPSRDFPPQYQAWLVLTTDGKVHRGLQLDHKSRGAIVLTLEDGNNRYFKSDEIEAYQASPTSLMPEGLADTMTPEEFRDLIAYLMTMRSRRE